MTKRVEANGLQIDAQLHDFITNQALPGTGVDPQHFWASFANIVKDMTPRNRSLLAKRDALQAEIDNYHLERKGQPHDAAGYKAFLRTLATCWTKARTSRWVPPMWTRRFPPLPVRSSWCR
jgi:malate synthase